MLFRSPIAARLQFVGPAVPAGARAIFDWRETEGECWTVSIVADGDRFLLSDGGTRLSVNGTPVATPGPGEYPAIYARFAALIDQRESDVDVRPLELVADAFMLGDRNTTDAA